MSNLIKSRYIYVKEEEKKIIDSNTRIEELRSLYEAAHKPSAKVIKEAAFESSDGFVEGLHARVIETADIPIEGFMEDPEQILNEAKSEAARILETAREQAEKDCSIAIEEARQKGYEEGHKKAMTEGDALKKELRAKAEQMDRDFARALQDLEPEFAEIVAILIQKITGVYIQDKKDIIIHLLHKAMIHADNSKEFHIKVSGDDYETVLSDRENLLELISKGSTLEIGIDKSLEKNQCLIETDTGIIDCSLDVQLESLKQDLKLLSIQTD